jgi:hypothetical protein
MKFRSVYIFILTVCIGGIGLSFTGCGPYRFNQVGLIPDSVKTVKINFIENRAPYVNPQLSPNLTDRIRQRIVNQTRLTQTNNDDNAHWVITGTITDYSVSTAGVSDATGRSQSAVNRLTVTVQIVRTDMLNPSSQPKQVTVSRSFDFSASQSLQAAEAQLLDEMVRNLTDEIFNQLFSDW